MIVSVLHFREGKGYFIYWTVRLTFQYRRFCRKTPVENVRLIDAQLS
jgi:hypothetical protein